MTFLSPEFLLALVPAFFLLVAYLVRYRRQGRFVVIFPNVDAVVAASPRRALWRRHVTAAAFLLALTGLILAGSKPVYATRTPRANGTVVIALDTSLSMKATDVSPDRLAAAQRAATDFVSLLPPKLKVGLVTFAGDVEVPVAPTDDRARVREAIRRVKLGEGTAIGSAIQRSIELLGSSSAAATSGASASAQAHPRIVILSDGETTQGTAPPAAIRAASQAKIPVSSIAFGTLNGKVKLGGETVKVPVKQKELRRLATETGGQFFYADSAESLFRAYESLGNELGYETTELAMFSWFLGGALLFGLAALAGSLAWSARVP